MIVSELKAAAVDVVTAWAVESGLDIVYIDNEPIPTDASVDMEKEVLQVVGKIKSND